MMANSFLARVVRKTIQQSPLSWTIPDMVMRTEVIQRAITELGTKRYLEIGVSNGLCFCTLSAPEKIGVDPIEPAPAVAIEAKKPGVQYFMLPSDEFFEQAAPRVLAGGVDVVFIDGLHTYAQAYRDCVNSLKYLNQGGLILMHDCLPTSELEARVAVSLDEAYRLNSGIPWDGAWTGDVWKAILRLRSQHPDLNSSVLHCDHGIGVVYRGRNDSGLSQSVAQIESMTYTDLTKDIPILLGLRRPKELMAVLKKLKSERR